MDTRGEAVPMVPPVIWMIEERPFLRFAWKKYAELANCRKILPPKSFLPVSTTVPVPPMPGTTT